MQKNSIFRKLSFFRVGKAWISCMTSSTEAHVCTQCGYPRFQVSLSADKEGTQWWEKRELARSQEKPRSTHMHAHQCSGTFWKYSQIFGRKWNFSSSKSSHSKVKIIFFFCTVMLLSFNRTPARVWWVPHPGQPELCVSRFWFKGTLWQRSKLHMVHNCTWKQTC